MITLETRSGDAKHTHVTYTEGAEQRRPEQVVEHPPGLTTNTSLTRPGGDGL